MAITFRYVEVIRILIIGMWFTVQSVSIRTSDFLNTTAASMNESDNGNTMETRASEYMIQRQNSVKIGPMRV